MLNPQLHAHLLSYALVELRDSTVDCHTTQYYLDVERSGFIAMVSSLIARWWVRSQSQWQLWRKALMGVLVPDTWL